MICAEFKRFEDGWKVDAEWQGYRNANIIEAFEMENILLLFDRRYYGTIK